MKRTAIIALLSGAFFASCTATNSMNAPQMAASDSKEVEEVLEQDPNAKVCEVRDVPGSIIPQKVCMTVAEKEALKKQAADAATESQRNALRTCAAGAGCLGG